MAKKNENGKTKTAIKAKQSTAPTKKDAAATDKKKKTTNPPKNNPKPAGKVVKKSRPRTAATSTTSNSNRSSSKTTNSAQEAAKAKLAAKNSNMSVTKLLFSKPVKTAVKPKPANSSSKSGSGNNQKGQGQKLNGATSNNQGGKSSGNNSTSSKSKQENDKSSSSNAATKPSADKFLLNIPNEVRLHGFSSVLTTMQKATPKVKHLLLNECDLIMECRYCRNLFRSLPNFISHKLNYCKSLYHPTAEDGCTQLLQNCRPSREITFAYSMKHGSESDIISSNVPASNEIVSNNNGKSDSVSNGPIEIQDVASRSSESLYKNVEELQETGVIPGLVNLALEPISGRSDNIMFQKKVNPDKAICDSSNDMVDNREVVDRDTAILGPDGRVICTGTQRGMERIMRHLTAQIDLAQKKVTENGTNAEACDICKTVFDTEKALRQHRRDAPDCVRQSSSTLSNVAGSSRGPSPMVTPKKLKMDEEQQQKPAQLVKQLFSKSPVSHLQRAAASSPPTSIIGSSPISKLSPYKKSVGKAFKNLQNGNMGGKANTKILCVTTSVPPELKFPCVNCQTQFKSAYDMSIHLQKDCAGHLAIPVNTNPAKRICIEDRSSYIKIDKVQSGGNNPSACANTSKNKTSNVLDRPSELDVNSNRNSEKTISSESTGTTENYKVGYDGVVTAEDGRNKEQDTISNATDSGVSLSTGGSDNEDIKSRDQTIDRSSPLMNSDDPFPLPSSTEAKGSRTKRKQKGADDRVLVPKNKNLKLTNEGKGDVTVLKRTSIRNVGKSTAPAGRTKTVKKSATGTNKKK